MVDQKQEHRSREGVTSSPAGIITEELDATIRMSRSVRGPCKCARAYSIGLGVGGGSEIGILNSGTTLVGTSSAPAVTQ